MSKKERAKTWKQITKALEATEGVKDVASLNTWVEGVAELVEEMAQDYEENQSNLEESPGLLDKWEEANPTWEETRELADSLAEFDVTNGDYDTMPVRLKGQTVKSAQEAYDAWLEGIVSQISDQVNEVAP